MLQLNIIVKDNKHDHTGFHAEFYFRGGGEIQQGALGAQRPDVKGYLDY